MKNNTALFTIGFASSFTAGLALVYLYNKWDKQGTLPMMSASIYNDIHNTNIET